jgi:hypothetical protein
MAIRDDQPQRPTSTASETPKRPRGKAFAAQIEATNALALANRDVVNGMQTTLKSAVEAQIATGQQAAKVAAALESGEIAYVAFQHELAALRQEPKPLFIQWDKLDVSDVLPDPKVLGTELADFAADVLIQALGESTQKVLASSSDSPIKPANP